MSWSDNRGTITELVDSPNPEVDILHAYNLLQWSLAIGEGRRCTFEEFMSDREEQNQ